MKDDEPEQALHYLREAFKKAQADSTNLEDHVKFKVQEMHFLNELYKYFNSIEYETNKGSQTTWFEFSKSIKNNILIELNINSLIDIFELNTQTFKDVIGSLNWKKFAERIKTQLKENEFLTQNQRKTMQFNTIISLIKSNSIKEAQTQLDETIKKAEFKSHKDQSLLGSVKAYLFIKDKKYQEALDCLKSDQMEDMRTVLLKSHLLLALKQQKKAIVCLVQYAEKLVQDPDNMSSVSKLFNLIQRLANNYKFQLLSDIPDVKSFVSNMINSQMKQGMKQLDSQFIEVLI